MKSVVEVIENHFDRWRGNGAGVVDLRVLGTDQPTEMAARVNTSASATDQKVRVRLRVLPHDDEAALSFAALIRPL
jgi:hypothetical protein